MFMAGIGACAACNKFVASVASDPYPTCIERHGQKCDVNKKCDICALWDKEQWQEFTKFERKQEVRKSGSVKLAKKGSDSFSEFFQYSTLSPNSCMEAA